MKLLTFHDGDDLKLGALTEAGVRELSISPSAFFADGLAQLPQLQAELDAATGPLHAEDTLKLAPCVPQPGKIICVGLNYRKHAAESGMSEPSHPILFAKYANALAAHQEAVPILPQWNMIDYEAELVVVIGRRAWQVSEGDALHYVLGYCNANDLSERGLQFRGSQWLLGKTLDKFLPLGPYLVTADSILNPQDMPIRCWLNGELRQQSNTSDMLFGVAQLLQDISHHFPLLPGDIISTGTPEGVIIGRNEKTWLKAGDRIEVEIGSLGRLSNTLVAADA